MLSQPSLYYQVSSRKQLQDPQQHKQYYMDRHVQPTYRMLTALGQSSQTRVNPIPKQIPNFKQSVLCRPGKKAVYYIHFSDFS